MYRVYYTDPDTDFPHMRTLGALTDALNAVEHFRNSGMTYVTMVSDHPDMCGKPGAKMSGSEYVPQMLN